MKILIISVHPDDETLGCGGTILKHKSNGDILYWLIITQADETLGYSREFIEQRGEQIRQVSKAYGFERTFQLDIPSTKVHAVDFNILMDKISAVIREVEPEVVYSVNRSDIHTDHQVVAKALMSCTKSFRNPGIKRLLMYECLSETEIAPPLMENLFVPNVYSDISEFLEKKIEIMKIYDTELQEPPLPRSLENIRALAQYRGGTVAVQYAEAFMLVRDVF